MGAEHGDKVPGRPIRCRGGREAIVRSNRKGDLCQLAEGKGDELAEQTQEEKDLGQYAVGGAASVATDACGGIAARRR